MPDTAKLFRLAEAYSDKATMVERPVAEVVVPCSVFDESSPIRAITESHDFAIHVGSLLVVDKIEGQELQTEDVAAFLDDLLKAIKEKRASVAEYGLLGKRAYALRVTDSALRGPKVRGHTQYETLTDLVVKKFGKELRSSTLVFS